MKLFGWKSAGRGESRPVLSRVWGTRSVGEWPASYEAQVRAAYLDNAIAQRSVRLVADGLGEAPLRVSSPEIERLLRTRSGGQGLLATLAAHLLLHGIRRSGWTVSGWRASRCGRRGARARYRAAMPCAAGWRTRSWR